MTAIDDALNSSTPLFDPVDVTADWTELPPGVSVGGVDSLRDLGPQIGPDGVSVSQSFDDGLPGPVTMTSSNDASGSMSMDLVGRPANIADVIGGWRNVSGGTGSGTSFTPALPSNVATEDYVLVTISVNNTSYVWEDSYEVGDPHGWTLLGSSTDGGFSTYVFGHVHYASAPSPVFRITTSGSYTWGSAAIAPSTTANSASVVPVRPGVATSLAETVSQTGHTGPLAALPSRGYLFGVFSSAVASGPWTAVTGTQLTQNNAGVFALQTVRSTALVELDGDYQFVSNTNSATATAMMITIPLIIMDRPKMDAMAYFSPFNADSPIRDFERDTASVSTDINVVAPDGVYPTRIFQGQMADIEVDGRTAAMNAVSSTRLKLDKSLVLPTVFSRREGCTNDWLASYLLAHGGQYVGVAPSPQTRFWAPCHGSAHPHMTGPNSYANFFHYTSLRSPTGPWGLSYPEAVVGPFSMAMAGKLTTDEAITMQITGDDRAWPTEVPGMEGEFNDLLSQSNNIGRFTCWLRGDVTSGGAAPPILAGATDDLFNIKFNNRIGGADASKIQIWIRNNRNPQILRGHSGGISQVELTGAPLLSDGNWHFFGVVWDFESGLMTARMDNGVWSNVGVGTTGNSELPVSEAALYAGGNTTDLRIFSRVGVAEIQLEAGPNLYSELFTRFYPTPQAPSLNATYRTSNQWIEAIAETAPVQGWEALQDLAQSTLYHLRVNEEDNVEFVPLRYFGETEQMTVTDLNVLDTDVNAGELKVLRDTSKTRNVVTLEYEETRVDSSRSSVMELNSLVTIPRGTNDMTFALDVPIAEVHGGAVPYGTDWDVKKLTATQVSGAVAVQNEHVMSVNLRSDGQGTVVTSSYINAKVVAWTSSTVTVRFVNLHSADLYLVNTGSSIPFLRILGYPVKSTTAYSTARDGGSIGTRNERALTTQVRWIQTRAVAGPVAGMLATLLSRPRLELSVTVMGDPRRVPGQLVSIADSEGTRAEGTWRILKVDSRGNGPMFIQDLQLVRVGAIGVWDEGTWDEVVWGE